MHAIEGSSSVPAFLTKLWRLVDDPNTNDLINWTQSGRSFLIQNQAIFARDLLPQYYKHNNMASFVRQLNMYGFHKVVSADSGGLRVERDEMEFAHPHFLRGQEELLENIKRKIPASRTVVVEEGKTVNKLLGDLRDLKHNHDAMNTKFINLKRENEALWREYASMRQKFSKQQQIIEKLIHFLIAMVKSPSKTLGGKRKFGHLALQGAEEGTSAAAAALNSLPQFSQTNPIDLLCEEGASGGGAQIHEVTDVGELELEEEVEVTDEGEVDDPPVTPQDPLSPDSTQLPLASISVNTSALDNNPPTTSTSSNSSSNQAGADDTNFLTVNGEPFSLILASDDQTLNIKPDIITASSVVSPQGTVLEEGAAAFTSLLDESPLSPELLNTVDPSSVTQSFKYPTTNTSTTVMSSKGKSVVGTTGGSKVRQHPKKGKGKAAAMRKHLPTTTTPETTTPSQPSMSVAVPEKVIHKQEFQHHMDEMQSSIDSLQDFLNGGGNYNVDPSMLLSVFGSDPSYLPELDSLATGVSGNEVSVYNPSFFDLAEDIDEDPLNFLNSSIASINTTTTTTTNPTTTTASSSSSSSSSSHPGKASSSGGPPHKQLKVNIKKEKVDNQEDDSLQTPLVSPATNPLYRGKRRTNN
ncbi:hypothetical protein Pcinc_017667 [Petrolisthes cinctipes]|uniref:HSF-type DNA-binding domain-containing protein n=1 Tax=Petrolisthes cinctipes TaxID=88211 RepID=A0AAE1FNQ2_PETCI|nr:hypothetical protein Pcinc_017667 [Petrolisthes cinctipes]